MPIAIEIDKPRLRDFCQRWKDVMLFDETAPWSLLDLVEMKEELEQLFGRRVDLLERDGVERSCYRREAILSSAVLLDVASDRGLLEEFIP